MALSLRKELDLFLLQIPKDLVNIIEGYTLPSIPMNLSEQIKNKKLKRYKWLVDNGDDVEGCTSFDTCIVLLVFGENRLNNLLILERYYVNIDISRGFGDGELYQSITSYVTKHVGYFSKNSKH